MFSWWKIGRLAPQLENDWNLSTDNTITFLSTICCLFTTFLFLLVYFPFLLYHFIRYYRRRRHIVFRKRRNYITHSEVSLFLIKIVYGAIMYNAFLIFDTTTITFNILLCIDECLLMFILYLFVWRFLILHYDLNWTVAVVSNEWQVLLNSTQQNWYIMNRKTLGSSRYVFIHYILPSIFISWMFMICNVFAANYLRHHHVAQYNKYWGIFEVAAAMIEVVPFLILIIIFYKTRRNKFDDQFYILSELKYIFICLLVDNIFNISVFACDIFMSDYDIYYYIISPAVSYNFCWGSQWIASLISTKWVNKRVESIVLYNQYQVVRKKLSFGVDQPSMSTVQFLQITRGNRQNYGSGLSSTSHSGTENYNHNANRDLFFKLLSSSQGVHAFINHLSKEFSVETLLFIIEVIQFQNYIKDRCKYDLMPEIPGSSLYEKISFPADMPQSDIVFTADIDERDLLYSLKLKAVRLFEKYIRTQSGLEVNISYRCRQRLTELMGNDNILHEWLENSENERMQFEKLLHLYDESCSQVFALDIDSFNRFKHTSKYAQLKRFKIFG